MAVLRSMDRVSGIRVLFTRLRPRIITSISVVGLTLVMVLGTASPTMAAGDSDGDGLTNGEESRYGTDRKDPDTDDDGLSDGDEVLVHSTNPLDEDSDNDWLLDGQEVIVTRTNPLDSDTDNDGFKDGLDNYPLDSSRS